jgi:hypothetical protein
LRLGQHAHLRREIGFRFEQQAVLRKEMTALRLLDRAKQIFLLSEPLRQRVGGALDQFGRRRVDHCNDQFEMRERFFHFGFALPPSDIRRDKLIDIGRHGEMRDRIPGRGNAEQNRDHDHRCGVLRAEADRADNEGGDEFHGCRRIMLIAGRRLGREAGFEALRERQNGDE